MSLKNIEEILKYVLYLDDEEIRIGIMGDASISDELSPTLKRKIKKLLSPKTNKTKVTNK